MSNQSIIDSLSVNRFFQSLTELFRISFVLEIVLFTFISISLCYSQPTGISAAAHKWVGTWSTSPQLVETGNNPPSPGLSNNTLRQVVHVSLGGDSLRMRFTNEFSKNPVTLNSVHIAFSKGGGIIDSTTDKVINFKSCNNYLW